MAELIEVMGQFAPARPIASLCAGTRANALRRGRRCYNHLVGRLGCALTSSFIAAGYLTGHDGSVDFERIKGSGKVVGVVDPVDYTLTDPGLTAVGELGAPTPRRRWTDRCPRHTGHCIARSLPSSDY